MVLCGSEFTVVYWYTESNLIGYRNCYERWCFVFHFLHLTTTKTSPSEINYHDPAFPVCTSLKPNILFTLKLWSVMNK